MLKHVFLSIALAFASSATAAPQIAILALPSGGSLQSVDQIPVNRGGVTMRAKAGTLAAQNYDNVTITGGLIDGTTIGSGAPALGYFSLINTTGMGSITFNHTGNIEISNNVQDVDFGNNGNVNMSSVTGNIILSSSGNVLVQPSGIVGIVPADTGYLDNLDIGQNTTAKGQFTKLETTYRGTFTANGATAVSVSDTHVTANSSILYGLKTVGGTPACKPFESAITAGTGFSVKACAGDTSTYNYAIIN